MRVHSVELSAFGPFADTQRIDFAELNQAGLFLLTGPTGAGKTSVLDAVCFALYGSVPGDRGTAKDLKSHHAGADDAPVVELDVSIRGRRFRVRRSPAWSRPSRRARSGFAERPAQARLSELADGEWRPVSGRIDEIGQVLTGLLGMSRDQFCQVVLLPQGKFQTFLSAGAKDRHEVLEALFETGRFKRVEGWLAERRRRCEAAVSEREARLSGLLARIEEANGSVVGERAEGFAPPADRSLLDTVAATCEQLSASIVVAQTTFAEGQESAKQAQHALDEAKALLDRRTRYLEARRAVHELDATADQLADRERRVERARAAAAVFPLVEASDRARGRLDRLALDVVSLRDSLAAADLDVPDAPGGSASAAEELRARRAAVDALRPLAAEVERDERRVTVLEADGQRLSAELEVAAAAVAALEAAADDDTLEGLRLQAARRHEAAEAARRAETGRDAAYEAAALRLAAVDAEGAVVRARAEALDARESWLSAREQRLASSAAILAAELVDGCPCAVCGSVDHPAPARPSRDHVSADDEAAALAATTALEATAAKAVQRAADVGRRLAGAQGRAGDLDPAAADAVLVRAREEQAVADAAAAELAAALETRRQRRLDLENLQASVGELATLVAQTSARLDETRQTLLANQGRLHEALGGRADLETVAGELTVRLDACMALAEAESEAAAATLALAEHDGRLRDALEQSPFACPADVRSATLSATEVANAEALNRSAQAARAAAERSLADPTLAAAVASDPPDLEKLQTDVDRLRRGLIESGGDVDRLTARLARLESLGDQLAAELDLLGPLLHARDVAASVAAMCAGTSPDNQTRTRLSHYVLSERLRQVVDAANERLAGIASGRYELVHTMDRGVGDTRGGLSLRVHDSHTGRSRDPATLSGGEGFYVSLALALGLADLVRDEIGGLELSTLFVDEGFGMLDAETLDEVMDELDSLRAGGRAVGIVSHLHELRLRIPTQVQVRSTPAGSLIAER